MDTLRPFLLVVQRARSVARSFAGQGVQAVPVQADLARFNGVEVAAGRIMPEAAKAATQARQTEPGSGQPD